MSYIQNIKKSWDVILDNIFSALNEKEELTLNLNAEDSVFVRFNDAKVRQNTQVEQANLELRLQNETQQIQFTFPLQGNAEVDLTNALKHLTKLRNDLQSSPADPFVVAHSNNGSSLKEFSGDLVNPETAVAQIIQAAQGTDFAGLYCAGPKVIANANSLGQRHYFSNLSFFVDYSLYDGSKAVKDLYAGSVWSAEKLAEKIKQSREKLALMGKAKIKLTPGEYRTYLAPGALTEVATMFMWGAFSYQNYKRGGSALMKLVDGQEKFSPLVSIFEDFSTGMTPTFNQLGEVAKEKTALIQDGELKTLLVSTRSAKEFSTESNQASTSESPRAMNILPGNLPSSEVLKKLGTGIYLSNLHYLNWSDVQGARITGMTRYACFWVENGEIQGPIEDMRFDDSLYNILGKNLEALTTESEFNPATDTYHQRSIGGYFNPGALLSNFKLTL
ncbi:MAG: TldD/PmbA family protein [Bdellovibrionia bacterium]